MIRSRRVSSNGDRLTTLVVAVATAMLVFTGAASAQVAVGPLTDRSGIHDFVPVVQAEPDRRRMPPTLQPIRDAIGAIDYGSLARQRTRGTAVQAAPGRQRSVGRKVLGGALGAAGGFFAGGYLGAAIEGDDCHCDDPGLKGVLIGAPIGAVAGGILGAMFF